MATKQLVGRLCASLDQDPGVAVTFESEGGVDVARRIREDSAAADIVVLATAAMRLLAEEGWLVAGSLRPMYESEVVAAVPASVSLPALRTETDLRAMFAAAHGIAYSTGPSGDGLLALIERWGLAEEVNQKLVQAPSGTPVGSLLASGSADLGFQQRSELSTAPGVSIVGPLPGDAGIRSTFSGAVLRSSVQPASLDVLDLMTSERVAPIVRACGMNLVQPS